MTAARVGDLHLADAQALADYLADYLNPGPDPHLARYPELAEALARARVFRCSRAFDDEYAVPRDLVDALHRYRYLRRVLHRYRDLDCPLDLERARDITGDLVNFFSHHATYGSFIGRLRLVSIPSASQRARASISPAFRRRAGARRAEVRVAPVAGRLVAAAALVLSARDRLRYTEEFLSELWEIARAGGGRRPQLAYAVRQVMAAPRLRVGLRVPRRRGAVP